MPISLKISASLFLILMFVLSIASISGCAKRQSEEPDLHKFAVGNWQPIVGYHKYEQFTEANRE